MTSGVFVAELLCSSGHVNGRRLVERTAWEIKLLNVTGKEAHSEMESPE